MQEYQEITPLLTPRRLYLKEVPHKGRGVFCADFIREGETIELCHCLKIPAEQGKFIGQTVLTNYVYELEEDVLAVVLGLGSFYNHSFHPNACFIWNEDETMLVIVALKDIPANCEITFNYHGVPDCKDPMWFENCVD